MIRIDNLTKVFHDFKRGEIRAVDGISLDIPAGKIFGLLGPNGAGKTTTLRILGTVLEPTDGHAEVCGYNVRTHPVEVRRSIGYVSANTGIYERMTPREMIRYFGVLYGMDDMAISVRTNEIIEMLDMGEFADSMCQKLSSGQKQKASIARTIVHNPPVLIFDEPTVSLDVLVARDVVDFIAGCRGEGRCVILSTHIMGEAEKLCDDIAIIDHGRIVAQGTREELCGRTPSGRLEDFFFENIDRTPREPKKVEKPKSLLARLMSRSK
ncbi:MAG: ABC transporter ATP-binding protein [Planctomycetota bacterium]